MYRVAITGIGIVSCLGNTINQVAESLRLGKSGIVVDDERNRLGFRSSLTGIIRDFNAKNYLSRKQRKTMTDFAIQAYAAVAEALAISGLGLLCFAGASTLNIWLLVPFLILYGVGYGGVIALRPSLVREYFSRGGNTYDVKCRQ